MKRPTRLSRSMCPSMRRALIRVLERDGWAMPSDYNPFPHFHLFGRGR